MVPFLSEAAEAGWCYFFKNWLMKLKCPHLPKTLGTIIQEKFWSFYPSEPFRMLHFEMRYPVVQIKFYYEGASNLFYNPFLSSGSEICWVDDTKLELSWCKWNFLAWCLVIFLRAINPITNSSKTIITIKTFAALSMGKITKSSLNSRNPCIGNWSKTVRSQKPANSGTFSVKLPK